MGVNAAGLRFKFINFNSGRVETFSISGRIKLENYVVFEKVREGKKGWGRRFSSWLGKGFKTCLGKGVLRPSLYIYLCEK